MLQAKIQGLSAVSDRQPKPRYAQIFVQGTDINAETYGLTPPKGSIVRLVMLDRVKETPKVGDMISFIENGNILTETKNAVKALRSEKKKDRFRKVSEDVMEIDEMLGFNYDLLMSNAIKNGDVDSALKLKNDRLTQVKTAIDESREKAIAYRSQNTTVLSKLTLNITETPKADSAPKDSALNLDEKADASASADA